MSDPADPSAKVPPADEAQADATAEPANVDDTSEVSAKSDQAEAVLASMQKMIADALAPIYVRLDALEPKAEDAHGKLRAMELRLKHWL